MNPIDFPDYRRIDLLSDETLWELIDAEIEMRNQENEYRRIVIGRVNYGWSAYIQVYYRTEPIEPEEAAMGTTIHETLARLAASIVPRVRREEAYQ